MTAFQLQDHVLHDIELELEQLVVDERLPGLSVGLVVDQDLAWFRGFGTRDLSTGVWSWVGYHSVCDCLGVDKPDPCSLLLHS